MHRAKTQPRLARWTLLVGKAATWAGTAVRTFPGVGGAAAISYGFGQAWAPLGWIVAGAFLILLDRRVP